MCLVEGASGNGSNSFVQWPRCIKLGSLRCCSCSGPLLPEQMCLACSLLSLSCFCRIPLSTFRTSHRLLLSWAQLSSAKPSFVCGAWVCGVCLWRVVCVCVWCVVLCCVVSRLCVCGCFHKRGSGSLRLSCWNEPLSHCTPYTALILC